MKRHFDTSVLVAALVDVHAQHERALFYLNEVLAGEANMSLSAHTLAELYATLTVLPTRPRLTPGQALVLIRENVHPVAEVIALEGTDYTTVIERMTRLGLSSGAVYDGLHVRAAEKAGADELLTCNGRDFRRMPPAPPVKLIVL